MFRSREATTEEQGDDTGEESIRILDRVIGLLPVIGTVILAVAVIYAVWFVLNSYGMEAITKMTQWTIDILKFARIRI